MKRRTRVQYVLNLGTTHEEGHNAMKRILVVLAVVMLSAALANAQYSNPAKIVGTYHDLSSASATHGDKATSFNQICFFCHTPHQMVNTTDTNVTGTVTKFAAPVLPLWNKMLSTYAYGPVYSSISLPVAPTSLTLAKADGSATVLESNLCLSCHDGTVGMNTLYKGYYTSSGRKSPGMGGGADNTPLLMGTNHPEYLVGNDATMGFRQEHPVNFSYTAALAIDPVGLSANYTTSGSMGRKFFTASDGGTLPLYDGDTMQCGSCHDVHNFGTATSRTPFLRATTTGSALCLTCHSGSGL